MIDAKTVLTMLATNPEVKKAVAAIRSKGAADYLSAIGLIRPISMFVPGVGMFAAGAVCGAAAALLLTPKTGESMRGQISDLVTQLRSKIDETSQTVSAKANTTKARRSNGSSTTASA